MTVYVGGNKIKDTGAYGVYVGSQNTNCLTYTPKNINLTLDPLNVTVVGSPTINNGIVSGLTSGNYVKTPNQLNLTTASNWEIVIKYTHLANGSLRGFCGLLTGDNVQCNFYITDSNTVQSDGVWGNLTSSTSLIVGSTYWTKLQFTGSQYILSLSTNGKDFINQSVINSTAKVSLTQNFAFGCDRATSSINGTVSIDLSQSYVKINGSTWWKGGTGAVTLKAGGKVYNRNGLLATTSTDLQATWPTTGTAYLSVTANGQHLYVCNYPGETVSSLPSPSTSYKLYYNTSDGKCYFDVGSWTEMSFPIAIVSATGQISSIDQIFDWCGYIGNTVFALPNVKGLIPDGFNTDGTYKSILFETKTVLTATRGISGTNRPLVLKGNDFSNYVTSTYDKTLNQNISGSNTNVGRANVGIWTADSTGKITSLTPYAVQKTTTFIPIAAVYNGSNLIYQYNSYTPETVILNTATAGTYTVTLKRGQYYIALTGAGGRASGGYYYACFQNSGGSGGTVAGNFYVGTDTTVTVVVGAGQSGKGNASTLSVGSTQMIYADGGNYCHANGSCSGNTGGSANSINLSGKLSNINLKAIVGNNGAYNTGKVQGAYSNDPISNTRGQGATSNDCNVVNGVAGGVYIKYIQFNK